MDLQFGQFVLRTSDRQLIGPDGPVELSSRSFDILALLVSRPDNVVSKGTLMEKVWPGLVVEDNTLQVHVSAIRKVLGPGMIMTVHGRGYKYTGPEPGNADAATSRLVGAPSHAAPQAQVSHDGASGDPPLPDRPSVAVLPFVTMSGDPADQYFSTGVSEAVTAGLTRFRGLFVIAGKSSVAAQKLEQNIREIGLRLGVAHIVEGSVLKAGERIRVTVRLVHAASGRLDWAESYDRVLVDIFAVQDEITRHIVVALAGRLEDAGREQAFRKSVGDLKAYDHLLRGQHCLRLGSREAVLEARHHFALGLEINPESAAINAALADSFTLEYESVWSEDRHAASVRAVQIAERAVALDPSDSAGWHALAWAQLARKQYDLSLTSIERAISLNPNEYDNLCNKGWCLVLMGETGGGVACLNEAIRVNPYGAVDCLVGKGLAEYTARQYESAVQTFGAVSGMALLRQACLAACFARLDRKPEASSAFSDTVQLTRLHLDAEPGEEIETLRIYLDAVFHFRDPASFEHLIEGLRKAGSLR